MRNLRIGNKLAIALLAFGFPLAFALFAIVSDQNIAILFAQKEVIGAVDLAAIAPAQGQFEMAALGATSADAAAAAAEPVFALDAGATGLDIAAQQAAFKKALATPGNPAAANAAARGALRDLIGRIGDRSDLILDNVLSTYYLTDVVLNRLPDVLDRLADLTLSQDDLKRGANGQSQYLIGLGALLSGLDGMDSSLQSAEQADGGDAITAALQQPYKDMRDRLTAFGAALQKGTATNDEARALVGATVGVSTIAAEELRSLLRARVHALHAKQVQVVGVAVVFFVLAVILTLFVTRQTVTTPLGKMTEALSRLAAGDLGAAVPCVGRGDELGAMARAMQIFKDRAIRARDLEHETAEAATRRVAEDAQMRRAAEERAAAEAAHLVVNSIGAGIGRLARGDLSELIDVALPPAYEKLRVDSTPQSSNCNR